MIILKRRTVHIARASSSPQLCKFPKLANSVLFSFCSYPFIPDSELGDDYPF